MMVSSAVLILDARKFEGGQLKRLFLDRLDLRYTFPRIHWFAELGKVPGS